MPQQLLATAKRARLVAIALATVAMIAGNLVSAYAAALTSASLELGDPRTGETTSYTASASNFTTGTSLECIEVELDTQADGAGSVPTGVTTTGSSLDSSTLITAGSWSVDNSVNGSLRITNNSGENPNASGNVVWDDVDNGSTEGTTYYAIMTTYSDDTCTTPVDSVTVAYIYTDGELVTMTIEPTLTFTCSGVAASQSVNGTTTTVLSNGSGINFGNTVTSSSNGISAHDLGVTTNATGGYNVYIRHSGPFENASLDNITVHTGTNGAPTAFPAAGTEAWGYTTEDADLTQFDSNEWAGFTTTNAQVATNPTANAGTETTRVGHQVGIAATTESGTYQTTLVYTIVATY